ncbi:MAG: hypothetical protein Devi2KO_40000 [Devosia indica]
MGDLKKKKIKKKKEKEKMQGGGRERKKKKANQTNKTTWEKFWTGGSFSFSHFFFLDLGEIPGEKNTKKGLLACQESLLNEGRIKTRLQVRA